MSDQGWNTPQDPNAGSGWNAPPPPGGQTPPPTSPGSGWGSPPPGQDTSGQQPPPAPSGQGSSAPPPPAAPSGGQQWGQQAPPGSAQPPDQWGQHPAAGQTPPDWGQQSQSTGGLEPPLAGLLAYLLGWIGGLIVYLVNKDPLSRFHGAQSILLSLSMLAIYIVSVVLGVVFAFIADALATLVFFLVGLLFLAYIVLSIYLAIQAYQGKKVSLPVVGAIAERWAVK